MSASILALFGNKPVSRWRPPVAEHHPKTVPPPLMDLFQQVPKTELHMHLSGSAPLRLVRQFLREQGWPEEKVLRETQVKDHFESLNDMLETYIKIPGFIRTPDQFRRAAKAVVQQAADENVRYMEIRSSILRKDGTPQEIVEALETGIHQGQQWVRHHKGYNLRANLIILAQRGGKAAESLETAKTTVALAQRPGSLIRGMDLAGSETDHPVLEHAEALRYFVRHGKPLGLKLTVHAGETATSKGLSGADSIRQAVALGADRIGHGLQVESDPALKQELQRKGIHIEACPWSNVQLNSIPDYKSHPLSRWLKEKLNVSLSTDNRMISNITLAQQLGQLYEQGLLNSWDDMKTLVINGVRAGFMPEPEKKQLETEIRQEFAKLEGKTRFKRIIQEHLTPAVQFRARWA